MWYALLGRLRYTPSNLDIDAILLDFQPGTALAVANLGVLVPFFYRLIKQDGDFDSKPYTHYQSFQSNGDIRIRRVSDLVPSPLHSQTNAEPVSISVHESQEHKSETKWRWKSFQRRDR